jgi:ABC-type amino acid transport substrate-binding protein
MKKSFFLLMLLLSTVSIAIADETQENTKQTPIDLLAELTADEKKWLKDHPVIRVGGPAVFPPFHFYDQQGKTQGIGPEYVALIMNRLGIRVEYEKAMPWSKLLDDVKNRRMDVVACIARAKEREAYLSYSRPYISSPMVIITQKDAQFVSGLQDLNGKKVALVKKHVTGEWLKRDGIKVEPYTSKSLLDSLQAVSNGDADAAIENLVAATYLIQKHGLLNLKLAAPTAWGNYQLYFAVRKDWPILSSIINKALAAIPPEKQSAIRNKWITFHYEYGIAPKVIAKWAGIAAIPIALFILFVIVYNRRLRKEILRREEAEKEREQVIDELKSALDNVKQLKGLLPICSACKKIRDDQGYWQQVEEYVTEHSEAEFSHSICPQCMEKIYPEAFELMRQRKKEQGKSN